MAATPPPPTTAAATTTTTITKQEVENATGTGFHFGFLNMLV